MKTTRLKVLIHNRAGGQRRMVEVDKTRTLTDLEVGALVCPAAFCHCCRMNGCARTYVGL